MVSFILGFSVLILAPNLHAFATNSSGNIYAIGGDGFNTVEKYNPSTNTWSTVAPMPTARGGLAAAVDSSGNIYAIGGTGVNGYLNLVEKYNPGTGTWSTVAPMPTARGYLAAASDSSGNIYAIGGLGINPNPGNNGPRVIELNTVEKYNPSTNTWSTVAPMSVPRYSLAAAVDSTGNIYAIGGRSSPPGPVYDFVEKYNPSTNTWSTVAPMPTARGYLAAASDSSGNIYAIGGFHNYDVVPNTVEKYNPSTNTWSTVAPMPTAREGLAAAVDSSGNIYAIGGKHQTPWSSSTYNTVEKYNPSTNTWSTVAPMPTARDSLAAVSLPSTSAQPTQCTPGNVWLNGHCVPVISACPTGDSLQNGACILTQCPAGDVWENNNCVSTQNFNFKRPFFVCAISGCTAFPPPDCKQCNWNDIVQNATYVPGPGTDPFNSLPIVAYTDKPIYDHNSIITLAGHVNNTNQNQNITLQISDPSGKVVNLSQISIDNNGTFATTLNSSNSLMSANGLYEISVQQGLGQQSKSFQTEIALAASVPEFGNFALPIFAISIISLMAVFVLSNRFKNFKT